MTARSSLLEQKFRGASAVGFKNGQADLTDHSGISKYPDFEL